MEKRKRMKRRRERVGHRHQLLRERKEREEVARERAMEAVRRREERLEQLRKTVCLVCCFPQEKEYNNVY